MSDETKRPPKFTDKSSEEDNTPTVSRARSSGNDVSLIRRLLRETREISIDPITRRRK